MAYQVGISSGWWNIGKDPNLLGLAQKAAGTGATAGVTFNQIDLESMAEFLEPRVRQNMLRVQRELGLKIGLHAEIGRHAALESAERTVWDQSHNRLCDTIKNAAELNCKYINFHLSSTHLLSSTEAQTRIQGYMSQSVTPDGKPFFTLGDKSPELKKYITGSFRQVKSLLVHGDPTFRKLMEEEKRKFEPERKKQLDELGKRVAASNLSDVEKEQVMINANKQLDDELERRVTNDDFIYKAWSKSPFMRYVLEAGEIDAYVFTAQYMKQTGDMLWSQIAKNRDPDEVYVNDHHAFNAAIASKYLEGHLTVKDNRYNKELLGGMSAVEYAQKKGIYLCFELPEGGGGGTEGLYRLFDPRHSQWLIRKINSPFVKLCIDFEHMLAQRLDPYKIIPELPGDVGKLIYLFHLGEPKPYWGTAHIPIPLGSQAQEIIYEWLYMFRQKGFKDGILIFERGGGRTGSGRTPFEVFEQSVQSLRQIAESLEKGVPPKELPLTFYGLSDQNLAGFRRQEVAIREHAWDPLEGVLMIPEEKHTFLSRAAVEKQKAQEWERRKFR